MEASCQETQGKEKPAGEGGTKSEKDASKLEGGESTA